MPKNLATMNGHSKLARTVHGVCNRSAKLLKSTAFFATCQGAVPKAYQEIQHRHCLTPANCAPASQCVRQVFSSMLSSDQVKVHIFQNLLAHQRFRHSVSVNLKTHMPGNGPNKNKK